MRLALAAIPKRFTRRDGEVSVAPRLIRPRDAHDSLGSLIGLYEASLDSARVDFPEDRAAQLTGDHRLARCLTACLSDWYQWTSAPWPQPATPGEAAALALHSIDSPGALRLALYDHISSAHGGFLPATVRERALDAFASGLGLARSTLDALLAQDDPRAARLARLTTAAPSPAELAARYNQRAVESLLASASEVTWRIEPREGASLGTTVKRVCFLASTMGVSYEVAFDEPGQSDRAESEDVPARLVAERGAAYTAPTSIERARRPVVITLHGPREIMGGINSYGDRLARLCRALLGYRRSSPESAALAGLDTLAGSATVHLHGRLCHFALDERLTRLLQADASPGDDASQADDVTFDSSLEHRLHADFAALERAGETAGWRLEREPEPVIAGDTILVPDFALTRDQRRVYVEVAGYWRPDYRARKARKLGALRGAIAMIVAAPDDARAEFTGLDASYPFLWYRNDAISAPALVSAVERAYDDFSARLAALDLPRLLAEIARREVIPPTEAAAALRSYTRAEQARATQALAEFAASQGAPAPEWVDGLGLCAPSLLDRLADAVRAAVADAGGRLPLSGLTALVAGRQAPGSVEAGAMLARRAGLRIERASLFTAEVVAPDQPREAAQTGMRPEPRPPDERSDQPRRTQPRKPAQRTHSGAGWRTESLFPPQSHTAEDGSEPDATPPHQRDETRHHTR